MLKKIILGFSASLLLSGCSTPPYYDVWNMSTSPETKVLETKAKQSHLYKSFHQKPNIHVSRKASRNVKESDVEVSIVLSLIHYNLYSYDKGGKYHLHVDVEDLMVSGGESAYNSGEEIKSIPENVKVELEASYRVTSENDEIVFERIIKTKHQDKIHKTEKTKSIVVEDTFKENYDLFIKNFINENL